jgi:membrane protease YdiL (CAAX protease family)
MIIIFLWGAAFFLLLLATIVCGISCLRLKEQARLKAIDLLLVLATLLVVVNLSAAFLPKTDEMKKAAEASELNYVHKADLIAAGLTQSSYAERLGEPWHLIAHLEGVPSLPDALKESKKDLDSFLDKHPSDPEILQRLAIVIHEDGGDADAFLTKKCDPELIEKDETIGAIKNIYSASGTVNDDDLSRIKTLPDGWYRNSLLLSAYKKTSSQNYTELKSQDDTQYQSWAQRYIAIKSTTLVAIALSILFWFILSKRSREPRSIPVNYGFRKTYGCLLFVLYAQSVAVMVAGLMIGFNAGLTAAVHHTKLEFTDTSIPFLVVAYVAAAAGAWISTKYFICRPAGIGFQKTFWSDSLKLKEVLFLASVGLCISVACAFIVRIAMGAIPHSAHGTSNPFALQLVDSLVSGNPIKLIFVGLAVCIVAPMMEEVLFRGLLYPCLRSRWGAIAGIIVTALIFAAWHFDLTQFPALFIAGVVLTSAFEYTQSLRVSTFVHAFWNTWVLVNMISLVLKL